MGGVEGVDENPGEVEAGDRVESPGNELSVGGVAGSVGGGSYQRREDQNPAKTERFHFELSLSQALLLMERCIFMEGSEVGEGGKWRRP